VATRKIPGNLPKLTLDIPSGFVQRASTIATRAAIVAAAVPVGAAVALMVTDKIRRRVHPLTSKFPTEKPLTEHIDETATTVYTYGADLFEAMLEAIQGARKTVLLESYIWKSDQVGQQFKQALIDAAARGVDVYVIVDGFANLVVPYSFFRFPPAVHVLRFPVLRPGMAYLNIRTSGRDHRKILVVDDEVGFLGGINISNDYASAEAGGAGWRDVHCEIRGPAVRELAKIFRRVWVREGGDNYQLARELTETTGGGCMVEIVDNRELRKRWAIRRAYTKAINVARDFIGISNAYFLPDRGVRRALEKAVKRGVRVQVIVPEKSDVKAIQYAGEYMYGRLIRKGVDILCWGPAMMHAKTAVIDRQWSTIGSYNLDGRSLFYNLEVVAVILDRELGRRMQETFHADVGKCELLTLERYNQRGWLRRLFGWFFYQFRKWL
jgi:cardiolipin synthase